ncbi:DUF2264 domain-containing protein [Paenibacillus sp. V4I7]|uniref:DUF2264 domain-containing protein n=1 Tax=Paenibacillus sp. V4I7 TaxID=3042307 RepID=UPI002784E747|nr:DUF2264 domain-containing protein [Paenibacillus sp. V4I7]MDQ0902090.1 hypothetical protein [Paenibacillus sp. V4I7]
MAHQVVHPISLNPLQTRDDLIDAIKQLCDPVKPYYSKGRSRLNLAGSGAAYPDELAGFEGFSRLLWGLVPLLAGGESYDIWDIQLEGIKHGTDPEHEEYWGDLNNYDQRMVEMAALGIALCLTPDTIWEPLNDREKHHLAAWLSQINQYQLWNCNWLFFLVLVNLGLKSVGMPYDQVRMDQCLNTLDSFYLSDGWYSDGEGGHSDYYVPFAIHYYGLLYAKIMEFEDPERSRLYKSRAVDFAQDFIYWFAQDGSALPYGRSLAYRFAQSSFWSAAVYAGIEPFPLGVMKGLLLRNLRWWFKQPIFNPDGTLSVGYAYPNLIMAENYNSPGSPYWALKSFLPLALGGDHPFWTAEELPLPPLNKISTQAPPHLVICRQENHNHVLAFNSGHLSTNEHTHTSAKYEKFVYSNVFGFSVPRAEWGLAQGAFDSMLALSEGDNIFRVKRKCEEYSIQENTIFTKWKPWSNVTIQTWLIPGAPWHVRIHCIDSERYLDTADGGFALGLEHNHYHGGQSSATKNEIIMQNENGACGAKILYGNGKPDLIYPNSNTNIKASRTVIPTVKTGIQPGRNWLVSAFYGEADRTAFPESVQEAPYAEVKENLLIIYAAYGSIRFSQMFFIA